MICGLGFEAVCASSIKVGQVIRVQANQRVPADLVFLKTTEKSGSCFIRTDQLDGETDWKLRYKDDCPHPLSADVSASVDAAVATDDSPLSVAFAVLLMLNVILLMVLLLLLLPLLPHLLILNCCCSLCCCWCR